MEALKDDMAVEKNQEGPGYLYHRSEMSEPVYLWIRFIVIVYVTPKSQKLDFSIKAFIHIGFCASK